MALDSDDLKGRVCEYLEQGVNQHLASRSEFTNSHDLHVKVLKCVEGNVGGRVSAELSGTLNGRPVKVRAKAKRSQAGYAPGGAMGVILTTAVRQAAAAAFGNMSTPHVQSCTDEVLATLLIRLDRELGVPATSVARRWHRLRLLRWALVLVAWPALTALFAGRNPAGRMPNAPVMDWVLAAFLMSVPAGCLFAAAYAASALVMPASFFGSDLQGRRVMATSGVRSTSSLRWLCAVLVVGFLGCFVAWMRHFVWNGQG